MKNETEDFLIAFLFDIVFFAICVCIWLYLRKKRDESKISDNIYILNNQTQGNIKLEKGLGNDGNKKEKISEKKRRENKFRTFLNIKDDKIVNTEIKYYLFFLKANRNIIFSLCILGIFLVLPLYLSLPRNNLNNPSFFNYISAGKISDINVLTILFFITIIYSAISYTFIYLLWRKIRPNKKKTKKFLPQNFTIMVSHIDKNEINAYKIYKYFCNLTNNKVVSAYLILDYSIVYHEQKKIFNATKNLKLLKENEEKKSIKKDRSRTFFRSFLSKNKKTTDSMLSICDKNEVEVYNNVNDKSKSVNIDGKKKCENCKDDMLKVYGNKIYLRNKYYSETPNEEGYNVEHNEMTSNNNNNKCENYIGVNTESNDILQYIDHIKGTDDIDNNETLYSSHKKKKKNITPNNSSNNYDENSNYDSENKRGNCNGENEMYSKESSDEDDYDEIEDNKMNNTNIADKNYPYKLHIEKNLINNNNEMIFYGVGSFSNKEKNKFSIKLKKNKDKYNFESKKNIFNKLHFFKKSKKSHWKKKLKEHLIKFYHVQNETPKKSTGVCFVSFIDTKSVHDCIHNIPFTERNKWVISNAPPNYDIIWKNLKNHSYKICARFIILNALLVLANTIIILTVTSIDNIIKLLIKKYRDEYPNSGSISAILTTWLSPFIVIFVNSIIQPALITGVSMAIGFIRKSSEHTYVLQGNFIFLILNTILIPLLSLSPLSSIIKVMYSDEIGQWSTRLGAYLFNSSGFFAMRYLLHCCFLTCANQLLQIPQFSIRSIVKTVTKKEINTWTFDFGYWYGFNTTILALILTFSVAVPFILPLGSLYFFLRYYIDKYNLIYEVCRTNLDSHGAIIRTAIKFMLFSVAFFQLVMFTFFSRVQNKFISVGRNILFLSSSLTTLLLLCRSTEWVSTNHIKKKKGKRTFCYLCEKNVYVSNLKDLNKLKYAYANPYETKR
ncbi:conserved Plasmodium protein, unknown function [Plasmodium berghei]|uniref:CSC1-like protein, putative n=2 Tax=Plasmodium berghei TaxID=5821 RepID=A0A509ARL6_PLABA|nr:CSC1-like protein, putative [Plasmodium berghei ANKA]CXJ29545.1 conserved Plasmodium protein, unknown function [Plasmodium berghei]SCM27086.1 conserved Plasmodium protein, unknown function [Plasmodium berghei]SCN28812.1 conserved Plasmodium protein, unknown function [Plasmodium berghei]SCO63111.1 conserved Plasmodium protein, unknown function [Plasmodium berghei]SCO64559.1 conserved Plasmodium protein, unknown function [Plasmodium berghei]|eukprot:XP_034424458.1 CSC1-like protein, putative [Plasmodium berghei ANKA]